MDRDPFADAFSAWADDARAGPAPVDFGDAANDDGALDIDIDEGDDVGDRVQFADSDDSALDVDIDGAAIHINVGRDIDALIAARVTSCDVVELDDGAARVNAAVADGASLGEITKLVESDALLAANVARLARSAAFTGAVGERTSLPYAIMRLGLQGVRGVCLMSSLARPALRPGPLLPLRRQVWRECLASALACQVIAGFRGVDPDDAWLLGLLHDFGKVVALAAIEPDVDAADAARVPFWSEVMERHHCDAGWIVTDKWRLPPAIPFVTAIHHQPGAGSGLHDVVVRADRVVGAATRRGWQISAADIAAVDGVDSDDEAMAIRIALAKHSHYLAAIS